MNKFDENEALNFEASKKELIEKSNKRAWFVALSSCIISVILAIAIIVILPLKTVELRVIKVDSNNNVEIITNLSEKDITKSEATDKFFIANYVQKRESYYYSTLANDYEEVQLFSNDWVAQGYRSIYSGENARDKKYENKFEVEVIPLSIVLTLSAGDNVATVRAKIIEHELATNSAKETIKVLTISYKYYENLKLTEKERLINPFGLKIISYRKDNEVVEDENK